MTNQSYKVDPKTGALIFFQSPEAKQLQGLRRDVETLTGIVQSLVSTVKQLQEQIENLTSKEVNK